MSMIEGKIEKLLDPSCGTKKCYPTGLANFGLESWVGGWIARIFF